MNQKQKIIKTYKEKSNVEVFDNDRRKYLFQKYKHQVESNFLKKAIKSLKKNNIKILDVGCGTGRMLPEIFSVKKNIKYYGIDTSKEMIRYLKRKARKLDVEKNVEIKIGDAENIPFKDKSFDIVFSYHLLWHLPKKEQEKIIKEMLRICKNKGIIIFDMLNKNFVWEKMKKFFGKESVEIYKLSIKDIKEIIKPNNFKIEKINDFPIKNAMAYSILNIMNTFRKLFPNNLYHMIYFKVEKCQIKNV